MAEFHEEDFTPSSLTAAGKVGCVAVVAPFLTVIVAAASLYSAFANGFVLAHIWAWHAVPLGMRPLGWTTFAALMLCRSLLLNGTKGGSSPSESKPDFVTSATASAVLLAWPWVLMLIAYLIR